jgi:hypothetical protein
MFRGSSVVCDLRVCLKGSIQGTWPPGRTISAYAMGPMARKTEPEELDVEQESGKGSRAGGQRMRRGADVGERSKGKITMECDGGSKRPSSPSSKGFTVCVENASIRNIELTGGQTSVPQNAVGARPTAPR